VRKDISFTKLDQMRRLIRRLRSIYKEDVSSSHLLNFKEKIVIYLELKEFKLSS
jgi:hypothetical protein